MTLNLYGEARDPRNSTVYPGTDMEYVAYVQKEEPPPPSRTTASPVLAPAYLSARYAHPLDRTLRYVDGCYYVQWYVESRDFSSSCQTHRHRPAGIERFFNGYPRAATSTCFRVWWQDYQARFPGILPLRTNMVVRSGARHRLLGVVDLVLLDRSSSSATRACVHLLDWSPWQATRRLTLYQYLLETFYGHYPIDGVVYPALEVTRRAVVVFPDQGPAYERNNTPEKCTTPLAPGEEEHPAPARDG